MADHPSFRTLERARQAYRAGSLREAFALAQAAYRLVEEIPGAPAQAGIVVSWYGLLLGTVGGRPRDGLKLCRKALETTFWEPRVYEHVARLEILCGSRGRALEAVNRGLQLAERDQELRDLRQAMGFRQPPPLSFLGRSHPINRYLGALLYRFSAKTSPGRAMA